MAVTIGINGFGRIGRYLTRLVATDPEIELAVINARADNAQLAHLLKYDSVHGRFAGTVTPSERGLVINGREVAVSRHPGGEWRWADHGCHYVVETTGKFVDRDSCEKHLASGAIVEVLPDYATPGLPLYLAWPLARQLTSKTGTLLQELKQRLSIDN